MRFRYPLLLDRDAVSQLGFLTTLCRFESWAGRALARKPG
jgi:hypothetical protein